SYVKSLARPGGNITGVFFRQPELTAKKVELLTQTFPEKTRLAVLWDALTADGVQGGRASGKVLSRGASPAQTRKSALRLRGGVSQYRRGRGTNGAGAV